MQTQACVMSLLRGSAVSHVVTQTTGDSGANTNVPLCTFVFEINFRHKTGLDEDLSFVER